MGTLVILNGLLVLLILVGISYFVVSKIFKGKKLGVRGILGMLVVAITSYYLLTFLYSILLKTLVK